MKLPQQLVRIDPYYADLDPSLEPHPNTGDFMRRFDVNAVKDSIRNILLTMPFEKPFEPDYGVGIKRYLFELLSPGFATVLKKEIREQVRVFEPRAVVEDVRIGVTDENAIEIDIEFYVRGITDSQSFNLILERVK